MLLINKFSATFNSSKISVFLETLQRDINNRKKNPFEYSVR